LHLFVNQRVATFAEEKYRFSMQKVPLFPSKSTAFPIEKYRFSQGDPLFVK